jgi:hypothetical protein
MSFEGCLLDCLLVSGIVLMNLLLLIIPLCLHLMFLHFLIFLKLLRCLLIPPHQQLGLVLQGLSAT